MLFHIVVGLFFFILLLFWNGFSFTISSQWVHMLSKCSLWILLMSLLLRYGSAKRLALGVWSISMFISTRMTPIKNCERLLNFHYFFSCADVAVSFLWFFTLSTFFETIFISFGYITSCFFFISDRFNENEIIRIVFVLGLLMLFCPPFVAHSLLPLCEYWIFQFICFDKKY